MILSSFTTGDLVKSAIKVLLSLLSKSGKDIDFIEIILRDLADFDKIGKN